MVQVCRLPDDSDRRDEYAWAYRNGAFKRKQVS